MSLGRLTWLLAGAFLILLYAGDVFAAAAGPPTGYCPVVNAQCKHDCSSHPASVIEQCGVSNCNPDHMWGNPAPPSCQIVHNPPPGHDFDGCPKNFCPPPHH